MPATLREVLKTNTFEEQRQIINTLGVDFKDYVDGNGFSSIIRLDDGTSTDLALFFDSEVDLGFYKSSTGSITFTSGGSSIVTLSDVDIKLNKRILYSTADVISVSGSSGGSGYTPGNYTNQATLGGSGTGLTLNFTVLAFTGTITNPGSGYDPGIYSNQALTNVSSSGSGGTATITVAGLETSTITNTGSGYAVDQTFTNVPLQGGTGTGARATLSVDSAGQITTFSITNQGDNGYTAGDTLTVLNTDLLYDDGNGGQLQSGGSGFQLTVNSNIYTVTAVNVPTSWSGSNYLVGDIVSASIPGGSGFQFTFTNLGVVDLATVALNQIGFGYSDGDIVRPDLTSTTNAQIQLILDSNFIERAYVNPTGDALFNNINVSENVSITGNATINGTATIGSLNLLGTLSGASLSGDSISVAGNITSGGILSVSGAANQVTEINGDISLSSNLFQIDDSNNYVSINGPTGNNLEDYLFEVYGISKVHNNFIAAVDTDSGVSIGADPGVGTNPVEKLVVTGNTQTTGNYYVGDGLSAAPAYSFITDKTLGLYKAGLNQLGLTAYNGDMAKFSSSKIEFYKPFDLINEKINEYTISPGRGYEYGTYTDVVFSGGTGADFTADITVAFTGDLVEPGVGYTDADYFDIPLIYKQLDPGAISTFGTIVGGSNYSDGTYTSVLLTNVSSSGTGATADITIENGSVISVTVVDRGSGYAVSDVLSANTSDIGGPILVSGAQLLINSGGTGYSDGTYNGIALTNVVSNGVNATANITVSSGIVTLVEIVDAGYGYLIGDTLSLNGIDLYSSGSYTLSVSDDGANTNYVISGSDSVTTHSSANDPTITVNLGDVITFNVNAIGHPFTIVTDYGAGQTYDPTLVVSSVTNNGSESGSVVFDTSLVTVGTYYYLCQNHPSAMTGVINVVAPTYGSGAEFEIEAGDTLTGSGFTVAVSDIGGTGNGTGATANITVTNGVISSFAVNNGGNFQYAIGDILTANYTDFTYVDEQGVQQTSQQPTTDFEFQITDLSSISYIDITNFGAGYSVNDSLALPESFSDLSFRSGYVQYQNSLTVNQGEYIWVSGGEYVYVVTIAGQLGSVEPIFGKNAVSNITINNAGIGYSPSRNFSAIDVTTLSGVGTGLKVDVSTNASGSISSITPLNTLSGFNYAQGDLLKIDDNILNSSIIAVSISQQSGDYEPDGLYSNKVQSSTSGNGTGAIFNISIDSGGNINSVAVVDGGFGYALGDTITITGSDFGDWADTEGNIYSSGDATFVVSALTTGSGNALEVAAVSSSQQNGTATIQWVDYQPSGFSFVVNSLESLNNVQFDSVSGEITCKKLSVNPDGIVVGNTLDIKNNTISTSIGNLILTADANSQTVVSGSAALALPSGSDAQRPNTSITGSIRYNTDRQQFEGLIQGFYVSLGGVRDVDGNTFISAELEPGADDNTIRFYNDGVLSQFVEQTKLTYRTLSSIEKHNLTGIDEWIAGASVTAATLPEINYIFYGENVYSIDTSGTFDANELNFPTHTTGTETNGTVDLTYVRSVYGDLQNKSKNTDFTVEETLTINSDALVFKPESTEIKLQSAKSYLSVGFNPASTNSNQILKFTSAGDIQINKGFGSQTDNYQNILDHELKTFELLDTKLVSNTGQLDSSLTSSISVVLSSWDTAVSGKIFVEIEEQFSTPTTTPQRQYSELSYLISEDGQDIIYTENNKLYTNTLLGDTSLALDTSNPKNIVVNFAHTTGSEIALYNVKVVSQIIRR